MGFNQNSTFGFGANGGGGGGGSVTGANDGLSLAGTVAQLGQIVGAGGDPAKFLEPREIPFAGNTLTYVDRATGDTIEFSIPQPAIGLATNASDWSSDSPAFQLSNTSTTFDFTGSFFGPFSEDIGTISFQNSGNLAQIIFLSSGNLQIGNITSDSGDLLQVYGGVHIDVSNHIADILNLIPFVDASGNSQSTIVLSTGYWGFDANYNGTNGGDFQGNLNLIQNVNFTSGSEEQVGINQTTQINWETAGLGTANLIAISQDVRAQFNLQSATGSPAGAISVGSGGAQYGSVYFGYRGMNPSTDSTGKLTVINGGSQAGTERVLPLAIIAARSDLDNGGTLTLVGNYANYASDLVIGALGTLDMFIDYSAGGGVNFAANAFTVGTRIAFWAQDLSTSMNVTAPYAFKSEGANDLFSIASLAGTGIRLVTATAAGNLGIAAAGTYSTNVAFADLITQHATVSSVATFTPGAVGTFRIGAYANITAVTAGTLTITCTYTDENSNAKTVTFFGMGLTTAGLVAVGDSVFPTVDIRSKASSAITVVATFVGTSITFDVGATITQLR